MSKAGHERNGQIQTKIDENPPQPHLDHTTSSQVPGPPARNLPHHPHDLCIAPHRAVLVVTLVRLLQRRSPTAGLALYPSP